MSEFEIFVRSQGFNGDFQRGANGQYKADVLHFMEKAFNYQQSKIEKLSKRVDVLAEENLNLEGECVQLENRVLELENIMTYVVEELEYPTAPYDEVIYCSIKSLKGGLNENQN